MRMWLARIFPVGRRRGNAAFTRRQSAAYPNSFEANRRLFSSFYAARTTTAAQEKLPWPSAIGFEQLREFGSLTILQPACKPLLSFIRELHQKSRGPRKWKLTVRMTEEKWKVLVESGERARYEKMYRVEINDPLMSTDDKHLVVIGYEKAATEVVALLQRPLNEADEPAPAESRKNGKSVTVSAKTWQLFKEYGVPDTLESVYNVDMRATELPSKQVQLTLHGLNAEKVSRMLHHPPLLINVPEIVGGWLTSEGPQGTRLRVIRLKSGALLNPSRDVTSILLVGTSKASLTAKSIIEKVHTRRDRIPQAACYWLTNKAKGAVFSRSEELNRTFDTFIDIGPLEDDGDQARVVDLAVSERAKRTLIRFWPRSDETDTCIVRDNGAACMYVAGRPDNVQEASERLRKSQHIKLKKQRVSLAVGNYVARKRPKLENDDLQIHLRYEGMPPGSCELRRLHRVGNEQDDAKADVADHKAMQEIDFHEVVLEVHSSWAGFLCQQCQNIEADEGVGLSVSTALEERVLVNVAGSRTTVKRGADKVITLITTDGRYRVGDMRLRRIEGQCVDTTGFEKVAPVAREDLSDCEETFLWERLTSEQWRYAGPSSPKRKRKRSVKPKQHKLSENAKANNA